MRLDDWENNLLRVLEAWQTKESEWGKSDCSFLIADVVEAVTGGPDPFEIFRDKYDSPETAEDVVLQAGFENLSEFVASKFVETPVAMAHRGDVGFAPDIGGPMCMCVVMGSVIVYTAHNGKGLAVAPRSKLVRAFKVGWEEA